jgi:hypothetical protein
VLTILSANLSSYFFLSTMSSPSSVVLRVETHRIRDGVAERNIRWSVLGTLQDVNWDRAVPLALGPQLQPYVHLVDARDLVLDPAICLAYLKAEEAWHALIREEAFNYNGCAVYTRPREELEETMEYCGGMIDAAVSRVFESEEPESEEPEPTVATQPPWAGLYPSKAPEAKGAPIVTDEDLRA